MGDTAHCRAALYSPYVESAAQPADPEFGNAAYCRAALPIPTAKRDEPDKEDAAPYRAALHRPVVEAVDDLEAGDAAPLQNSSSQICCRNSKGRRHCSL